MNIKRVITTWEPNKDFAELKRGDMVYLILPQSLTNEAVKARVDKPMGAWSY